MIVYGGCNWITAHRSDVGTWYYSWESFIPFVPLMIIPYMSINLFFVCGPFLCQSRNELRVLAQRITFAILVAGACFLLKGQSRTLNNRLVLVPASTMFSTSGVKEKNTSPSFSAPAMDAGSLMSNGTWRMPSFSPFRV